jgi:hypothetical protein
MADSRNRKMAGKRPWTGGVITLLAVAFHPDAPSSRRPLLSDSLASFVPPIGRSASG